MGVCPCTLPAFAGAAHVRLYDVRVWLSVFTALALCVHLPLLCLNLCMSCSSRVAWRANVFGPLLCTNLRTCCSWQVV